MEETKNTDIHGPEKIGCPECGSKDIIGWCDDRSQYNCNSCKTQWDTYDPQDKSSERFNIKKGGE